MSIWKYRLLRLAWCKWRQSKCRSVCPLTYSHAVCVKSSRIILHSYSAFSKENPPPTLLNNFTMLLITCEYNQKWEALKFRCLDIKTQLWIAHTFCFGRLKNVAFSKPFVETAVWHTKQAEGISSTLKIRLLPLPKSGKEQLINNWVLTNRLIFLLSSNGEALEGKCPYYQNTQLERMLTGFCKASKTDGNVH